jgi:type II secretory pathway component GspD/PulD (secretin)
MTIALKHRSRSIALALAAVLVVALWPALQAQAAPVNVTGVALKDAGADLQLSILATGPVHYDLPAVQPDWIVVDVRGAHLAMPAGTLPLSKGLVRKVRVGQYTGDTVRVVVELARAVKFRVAQAPNASAILIGIGTDEKAAAAPASSPASRPAPVPSLPSLPEHGSAAVPEHATMAQLPLPPATPPPAPAAPAPRPAAPTPTPPATPVPSAAGSISSQGLITLELRNANIADVIAALARLANANVVTDSDVKGTITVRLINVTFEDALRLILEPNGLGYATVGPNIIIAKKEKLARPLLRQYQVSNLQASVFAATYLPLIGLKKEQVAVDDGTNSVLVVGPIEEQAKVADILARVDNPTQRTVTRVIHLNYLDAAVFVDLMGARLPDSVTKGTKIDKASNSIVLTASAGQMAAVDALLKQVDTPLPQIMVEAMVLEVPTDVTHNLGVSWQTSTPFTINSTGGAFPCCLSVSISAPAILATLNTLIQQNKSKLLANPRLAVRDGETARMNIGDKIPFQVINAQGVPSVVIIEAGVKLEITPRIGADGNVSVKMHPEVSSIVTAPAPNVPPTIATREADTSLTVKDGTPIVLAGLIQKNDVQTTVKVPLLGDIPIIGWLFKSVSTDHNQNEVIFVITPHILQPVGS